MAREHKVRARITAKDDASKTLGRVEGRFRRLTNVIKSSALAQVASIAGVLIALRSLVRGIRAVVRAAQEQEDAVRALGGALSPLGDQADAVSKSLQAQAAALQQVTKFGDETIIRGQALIASFTRNEEEIKKATVAAIDLAAATGTDLKAAFLLLGRAATGETSTLSRYGIILDEGIPKSEKFAAALAKINEQFGGQAQAQADTYSGIVGQLSNAYGDLQEQAGFAVTKNEEFRQALKDLTTVLQSDKVVENVDDLAEGMAAVVTAATNAAAAIPAFTTGVSTFIAEIEAGLGPLRLLVETTKLGFAPLGLLGDAAGAVAGAFIELGEATTEAEKAEKELALQQTILQAKIGGSLPAFTELTRVFGEMSGNIEKAADEAPGLADGLDQVAGAGATATSATEKLGKALGVITSAEIETEIAGITESLEKSREELGANSREYILLEEVASAKLARLEERQESLRRGLGDLTETTSEARAEFADFGDTLDDVALSEEALAVATGRSAEAFDRQRRAALDARSAIAVAGVGPGAGAVGSFTFADVPGTSIRARVQVGPDGRLIFP